MKSVSGYDIIYAIFILCLLFTVGIHVGTPSDSNVEIFKTVDVRLTRTNGDPAVGDIALVDGKYEATLIKLNDGIVSLLVPCEELDAGLFAFRTKYLSLNQPLKFFGKWGYAEGRIIDIY